ncbi:hypothetical protein KM043_005782 [Ampulex compressa]|nr:hypothetical protein KM043_005782 [Ampulex compressa]
MRHVECILALALSFITTRADVIERTRPQAVGGDNGEVIDSIFNIPIAAIKQTAAVAQSFSPENTETIDGVFKIPLTTLEAVGNLVKATTAQRRQNAGEIQQIRQDRRDRMLAQKERQRQHREQLQSQRLQLQNQRLQEQQIKRVARHHHRDPLGLNAWADLLVGKHGLLGYAHHGWNGVLGGHGGHKPHKIHGHHGGHGNQGIFSGYPAQNTVNEEGSFAWHGITAGFGSIFGSAAKIENKVAPREQSSIHARDRYEDTSLQNKVAPIEYPRSRNKYQKQDPQLENKVAPRSDRVVFRN